MFTILVLILFSYLLYRTLTKHLTRRHNLQKALALSCLPPPHLPNPWYDPFGLQSVHETFRRAKAGVLLSLFTDRMDDMNSLVGRHCPTYRQEALGASVVVTSDPENLKAVLASQFGDFLLGKRCKIMAPLLGSGIFVADGKNWEHSRALLRPLFIRERISDLDLSDRHNANLHLALPVDPSTRYTEILDLQPLFFRLTIDSSSEFLFGASVNSQPLHLPSAAGTAKTPVVDAAGDFAADFDKAQAYLGMRFRLNNLYWLINTPEFHRTIRRCHDFIDHYIDLALHPPPGKPATSTTSAIEKQPYNFLHELALSTRDPLTLRYEILNILLAGRDTTASLLSWLFLSLSHDPTTYARLRSAILSSFPPGPKSPITFSSLKTCHYLQFCLSETLRLYPVVPLNGRTAATDTTLPRGGGPAGTAPVFVPKGSGVFYSVYVMHRDQELWGEDADVFRPERWEGRKQGWEFLPFNGGPRICLGQQFALTSAAYTAVRMVRRFESIESCCTDPVVRFDQSLTAKPAGGVRVRLREAKGYSEGSGA